MMRIAKLTLTAVAAASIATPAALAQGWPDKPIKMIVPFAAGGGTDFVARLAAKHLTARLGQSVYVENRGGANGIVGLQALKQSPPDGYTIEVASDGPLVINHGLYKEKLPYDSTKDWTPVHMLNKFVGLIVINPKVPAKTVKELIDYAKANPGKLNYGAGTVTSQLMGWRFHKAAGIDIVYVPFKGTPATVNGLLTKSVDLIYAANVIVNPDGTISTLSNPYIVVALMLRVVAMPGGEVDLSKVRAFILYLRNIGFPILRVTFDQFQSSDSIQILKKEGFEPGA